MHWNWAIAKMGPVNNNCANYSHQPGRNLQGNGFLLQGSENKDSADFLAGLNTWEVFFWFDSISIYIRRTAQGN